MWCLGLSVASACGEARVGEAPQVDAGEPPADGPAPPDSPIGAVTAAAGADQDVVGGLAVLLDGSGTIGASSYAWQQVEGDPIGLSDGDQATARVIVPADAPAGAVYRFRLTATDAAGESNDEVTITVRDAVFEDFLGAITDREQLGDSEGIAFAGDRVWVVSKDGFVSGFDADGKFRTRYDLGGQPVGAHLRADGKLVVANANRQAVDLVDVSNGKRTVLTNQLGNNDKLGPANDPLPDRDGNVFITNRAGQKVLRYDASSKRTRVFIDKLGQNPNALAFGPEPDVLYVGTVEGVWRVPIQPDGTAGTPAPYVSGLNSEVDGLAFDAAGNLFVGCPNTAELHVVPWVADGESKPSRTFRNVGDAVTRFISLTFGNAAFGESTLYWTNLDKHTVGRLQIGVPGLRPLLGSKAF